MIKYIEIYSSAYDNFREEGTENIKKQLVNFKNSHCNFYHALNTILNDINIEVESSFIRSTVELRKLQMVFQDRFKLLEREHNLKIINTVLLNKFSSLNPKLDYTFEEFILELARIEALKENDRLFRNYSTIYKMMYQVGVFDDFELVEYNIVEENTPLFKKYHELIYGKSKLNDVVEEKNSPPKKKQQVNNFLMKKEYKGKLEELFNFLMKQEILIEEKNSLESFSNVLLKAWTEHTDKIYFNNTDEISLIIGKIRFAFKNFTDVSIGRSELFSSDGTTLSRDNIVSSRRKFKDFNNIPRNQWASFFSQKQIGFIENTKDIVEILEK